MLDLSVSKPAEELRQTWQARALAGAKDKTAAVLLAVLIAEYPVAVPILLRVVFPGFIDVKLPALTGYATVTPRGRVVCGMIDRDREMRVRVIYESETDLRADFRRLADRLKLADSEREAMFDLIRKWVAADLRVNHEGERVTLQ